MIFGEQLLKGDLLLAEGGYDPHGKWFVLISQCIELIEDVFALRRIDVLVLGFCVDLGKFDYLLDRAAANLHRL